MKNIDQQRFGAFVAECRKTKGLTQKQLAEMLCVTDKAVSKWERGLSLPDISLLAPLAEALGVTVPELLRSEPLCAALPLHEVEELVSDSLQFSAQRTAAWQIQRRHWLYLWLACAVLGGGLLAVGAHCLPPQGFGFAVFYVVMGAGFGAAVLCLLPPSLPAYYDENKVYGWSNGVLRMNLPFALHNGNWPGVRVALFGGCLALMVLPAVLELVMRYFVPDFYAAAGNYLLIAVTLCALLLPVCFAAARVQKPKK